MFAKGVTQGLSKRITKIGRKVPKALTLVLGGAASGKSAYAEQLLSELGRPRVYMATAQAYDTEMAQKIRTHQERRGPDWETIEAPEHLAESVAQIGAEKSVLIDCLTLWLTNRLLSKADLARDRKALVKAFANCPAPIVAVSNETGLGIVPDNALARWFRDAQGQLNQAVAAQADRVVLITAGLPMVLK